MSIKNPPPTPRCSERSATSPPRRSTRIREHEPTYFDITRMDAADTARWYWPRGRTREERKTEREVMRNQLGLAEQKTDESHGSHEEDDESGVEDDEFGAEDDEEEADEDAVDEEETGDDDTGEDESVDDTNDDDDEGEPGRRSRTRSGWVPSSKDVRVTPPERVHQSWSAWVAYLKDYAQETMQVLPVKDTMSRSVKNERIIRTVGFKAGKRELIADAWDPYQRTYICTHGWKQKQRGIGSRPRQRIRYTKCSFRFVVQASPDRLGQWRLVVKNELYVHNHPVTEDTYGSYPVSRGIKCPINEARVDSTIEVGAKRSRIYDFLLAEGENVIAKDVENLIAKHPSTLSSVNDNDATAIEIAKFTAANPANVSSIYDTEEGHTGILSLTTHNMRTVYARFPEFLMVDCTDKTNRYNYQLLTFMVVNEYGEGMPRQQSVIEANGDWHMDRALTHFKHVHADKWKLLRVIMVDKDLNEIKILWMHFPEARNLICVFHTVKYLSEMCRKPVFDKISEDDAEAVETVSGA